MDTRGVKNPITGLGNAPSKIKSASAGRVFKIAGPSIPNAKGGLGPDKGLRITNG
jgi:hypothetical protein